MIEVTIIASKTSTRVSPLESCSESRFKDNLFLIFIYFSIRHVTLRVNVAEAAAPDASVAVTVIVNVPVVRGRVPDINPFVESIVRFDPELPEIDQTRGVVPPTDVGVQEYELRVAAVVEQLETFTCKGGLIVIPSVL